jgi:hypothetical protein
MRTVGLPTDRQGWGRPRLFAAGSPEPMSTG